MGARRRFGITENVNPFVDLLLNSSLSMKPSNPTLRSGRMTGKRERRGSDMRKECYFCKGKLVQQNVKVDFRWGQKLKIIENVPARVCQQCGEQHFQSGVYKAMEKLAASRKKPAARLTVDVFRFKEAV